MSETAIVPWTQFKRRLTLSCDDWEVIPQSVAVVGDGLDADQPCAAFLLSRLPRRIQADDAWLQTLRQGVEYSAEQGWAVLASVGLTGWEIIAWLANRSKCRLIMVLPETTVGEMNATVADASRQLELQSDRIAWIMPQTEGRLQGAARMHLRDRMVFGLADVRFPVAIRKGSYWEALLNETDEVDTRFISQYPKPPLERWRANRSWLRDAAGQDFTGRLVHWTHGVYGPWHGERTADYFAALMEARSGNPRDAFGTLAFIARSGILRGQGALNRQGVPTISFTERDPVTILERARYRTSLGRWNYEPYGIAIGRDTLVKLGGKKVIYGDKHGYDKLSDADKPFYQFRGVPDAMDWTAESEWRLAGDLDLHSIREDVVLITPFADEADQLARESGYSVLSLQKDSG